MITVNFAKKTGKMRPMHCTNNGPVYKFAADQRITNLDAFKEAGIPYARTHDASFYSTYGGEHTVDVHAIFPNFDKDPENPESYDFRLTDDYLKTMELAGVKPFYRLGSKIEHWPKKYGTLPPKDFQKWAVICEHIIRHYNYGWADGFQMGIEYWEIWNEPDLDADDSPNKRTWGGTKKQFFEFYHVAASYLKKCFPELKIGGPAIAGNWEWAREFLEQLTAPLDFFSWHIYTADPRAVSERVAFARELLDQTGHAEAESILNEWNYVQGWEGDTWIYSLRSEKGLKGAAFTASVMSLCQYEKLDLLMYYDARPCGMNGLFDTDIPSDKLKGYYPFPMFNRLYRLGESVEVSAEDTDCFVCAASNGSEAALMASYFNNDDQSPERIFNFQLEGLGDRKVTVAYYLLDADHNLEKVREETVDAAGLTLSLKMPLFSSYLITIR